MNFLFVLLSPSVCRKYRIVQLGMCEEVGRVVEPVAVEREGRLLLFLCVSGSPEYVMTMVGVRWSEFGSLPLSLSMGLFSLVCD